MNLFLNIIVTELVECVHGVKNAFRMSAKVELRSRQKSSVIDTGAKLTCQPPLNEKQQI